MEELLKSILAFIRRVFGADRIVFDEWDGSAAMALTITRGERFKLLRVELNFDSAPTTSENFTISRDCKRSNRYDVNYYTRNLSVGSVTDLVVPFGSKYAMEANDEIDIAFANTDGNNWGVRAVYEILGG